MKAKNTQEVIHTLNKNEIFVFGSNEAGNHSGGAAHKAAKDFGAINGNGEGLQGRSYAIPTLNKDLQKLEIKQIQDAVNRFEIIVKQRTDLHFLITPIGTGIAGFSMIEMAILFAGFQDYENVSLPKCFIDVIGETVVHGYKAVNVEKNGEDIKYHCRGFYYEIGSTYHTNRISICNHGFHFCENIIDTLNFYHRSKNVQYVKVIGCGKIQKKSDKHCVSILKICSEYLTTDKTWNTGDWNSGNRNSGDWNTGNRNSGDWNSGDWNSGNSNSGNRNSGNRNSGNSNSGDWNSGDWNSGNSNSGNRNSGNRNSGDWNTGNSNSGDWNSGDWNSGNRNSGNSNSGDRNSGDWNSGNSNSGCLNTITPKLIIFNKETDKKLNDIYFPNWMHFKINKWIDENYLTDEQKENYPYYNICGGALISIEYKEAAQKSYNDATTEEQRSIEDVPNYDAEILFDIFGIDRRKKV